MSLSYAHAASGVRRRARCRSRALGEPARPMRRNAARLKYRRRCVATRMNERARAHPAERGECRGRSMTRRARQGDRPRAERMRAASRASAAGLPRASRRRHLTRRRATGADFHPFRLRDRAGRASGTQRAQPHVVNAEAQERARTGPRASAVHACIAPAGSEPVGVKRRGSACPQSGLDMPPRSMGIEWRRMADADGHRPPRRRAFDRHAGIRSGRSANRRESAPRGPRSRVARHVLRRGASAARPCGVRGSRRHGRGRRGRGGRRANGFAGRAPRRYPCSGGSAAARGRTRSRAGAFGRHRPHSAACRVLVRYAPPSSRAALAGASHRPITPSAS